MEKVPSFQGADDGRKSAWYTQFAHARNYSSRALVSVGGHCAW